MSADEATPQEEQFAAMLAAFDDALAAGMPPPGNDAPAAIQPRLEQDLECLQLLHHLRPSAASVDLDADAQRHRNEGSLEAAANSPSFAGSGVDPEGSGERYTLTRLHARGGIGQVWLAHDADLDRDVALKELQEERARNPAIAARFLHEARITSKLQHPGIVPVYELVPGMPGINADGDSEPPFYTMRFVQGRTLTDAARAYHEKRSARPLDQAALLNAFISVCNTVAYAHSRGVIHRDLKGQNVVLGDFGEVMVLDWGFAKELGTADYGLQIEESRAAENGLRVSDPGQRKFKGESADCTIAGQVLGTPAYMAPEQAEGRLDLIDRRTDVYGLGTILYEILTGRPPFEGVDTQDILHKARSESPPRPETRGPGVPPALAAVCMRALARDPSARYSSAVDLGREVQRWLADEPVTAYRERPPARLQRFARRHKPVVASLVVLLATGLIALVVGTFLLQQEKSHTAAAKAVMESRARIALETQLYDHRIALAERELAANNPNRATQILAGCPEPLRSWEWYLLARRCHADVLTLRGHAGEVAAVAFSPDGRHLASASHDRTVRIWNVKTGQLVRTLTGHNDVVYCVAYSPDGARLATGSWDQTIKIWSTSDGRLLLTLDGHHERVWRVAYSPDGKQLASLGNGELLISDATTGAEIRTIRPTARLNFYGLAFSPDGHHVAVTMQARGAMILNVATGKEEVVFRGHTSDVKNVAFSPDGRLVATGAGDLVRNDLGEVKIWEAATGKELQDLRGHTDPIFGVAFSPDGRRLASASQDQNVKIWDPYSGRETLTIRAHADTVRAVAFSPDGSLLASASGDGTIKVWDASPWMEDKPPYEILTLAGASAPVFSVAFHPDGRDVAAAIDNRTIGVWNSFTGEERPNHPFSIHLPLLTATYSPDGKEIATATADGIIWFLDSTTGRTKHALRSQRNGPIKSLAYSNDGTKFVTANWDRVVILWDLTKREIVRTFQGHEDAVLGVAISPDGKRIASASRDKTVRLWDAETGKELHILEGHASRVLAVAFSPDGKVLASGSNDGTVRLWDVTTGQVVRTLEGHASGVYCVAFSPDGRYLASGSSDWTIKLWNPATGAEIYTLRGHAGRVHGVAFSPDSRRLASASADNSVKIWEVPLENPEAN